MVEFADGQLAELIRMFPDVKEAKEAGGTYYLIPGLPMPEHCTPSTLDALLCPTARHGYRSRLFLSKQVVGSTARNWNAFRILGRDWWAPSYQVRVDLRLAQLVAAHMTAFRSSA